MAYQISVESDERDEALELQSREDESVAKALERQGGGDMTREAAGDDESSSEEEF